MNSRIQSRIASVRTVVGSTLLIGAIATSVVLLQLPYQTLARFDDSASNYTHFLALPAVFHLLLVLAVLAGVRVYILGKHPASDRRVAFYLMASLILASQAALLYHQARNRGAAVNWSVFFPEKYMSKAVAADIAKSLDHGDLTVCEFFDNPHVTRTVSGVTAEGLHYNKRPSQKSLLDSRNGKIPEVCANASSFETARQIASYYPSLDWFGRECNADSTTEACFSTRESLLKQASPSRIDWHQRRFFIEGGAYFLEYVFSPEKGLLFVKKLPVKNKEINISETKALAEEADKINTYSIYHFDCAGKRYGKFPRDFVSGGNHWSNRPGLEADFVFMPLPDANSAIDAYYLLACH